MAWSKLKAALFTGAALLLVIGIVTLSQTGLPSQGRLRLPVGHGTPAISLGETHGLILASDGSLWSWGSDFLGWPVLGQSNVTDQTCLRRIGDETNWINIATSAAHNLAIKSDGTLWAWGQNIYGEFGVGINGRQNRMSNIPIHAAPGNDWKQAAAAGCFSVALKTNGTLWAWGNNWAGPLGIGSTKDSAVPVQVGVATNWIRVWAGRLETVGMQSDGSLWYWGENPSPTVPQQSGQILVPTRISPDTNWMDVGFSDATVLAIKSDGTLWSWGRNAHVYTGASDEPLDATPMRVGTNSDWQSISACGLSWCQGLTKKDGSHWLMDARSPYPHVEFRRMTLPDSIVAYTAGSAHAPAPGVYVPIGVALTRDGEVWTWGMVLGEYRKSWRYRAEQLANRLGFKVPLDDLQPIIRETPWQLPNQ